MAFKYGDVVVHLPPAEAENLLQFKRQQLDLPAHLVTTLDQDGENAAGRRWQGSEIIYAGTHCRSGDFELFIGAAVPLQHPPEPAQVLRVDPRRLLRQVTKRRLHHTIDEVSELRLVVQFHPTHRLDRKSLLVVGLNVVRVAEGEHVLERAPVFVRHRGIEAFALHPFDVSDLSDEVAVLVHQWRDAFRERALVATEDEQTTCGICE